MLVIAGVVGWSAYSYWSEYSEQAARKARKLMAPAVGAQCIIRLDTKGLVNTAAPLNQSEVALNQVVGQFVKLNDDWVVLSKSDGQQLWISRDQILLMRVTP